MPVLRIPKPDEGMSQEELYELLLQQYKMMSFLFYNYDHDNVKRLFTNRCDIRSAKGETVIDGPTLKMYDTPAAKDGWSSTGQMRLKLGYDSVSSDFVFELYNSTGVKTVGIDSNGNATFTGTITGSVITGGTVRTASTGDRIVITSNTLKTYRNFSGTDYLNGPVWGTGVGIYYGDLSFYDQGTETFRIENAFTGAGWTLRPMNGGALYVGYGGSNTYASGNWNFATAGSITGLYTNFVANHNHGIPNGTLLATAGGGSVEWVASGGHSHTVTL